jgi:hypothetical protein
VVTGRRPLHHIVIVVLSVAALAGSVVPAGAQNLRLTTATGGMTISGSNPNWNGGFGNVNGMGIGTAGSGVSVMTTGVSGGVLYTTPFNMVVTGVTSLIVGVDIKAHVSSAFSHPSVLGLRICYPAATCTSAASYTTISSNAGAPSDVLAFVPNGTYVASLGLFVSNTNGATAYSGLDAATVTFRALTLGLVALDTDTLTLNSPNVNVQTALRLLLAAAGGLAIPTGSDFTAAFGTVNGLGIGPAAGLSVTTVAGGVLYSTPYAIQPTFAGFSSTTGTVTVHVSVDFAHPTILELRHSSNNISYSPISKLLASPTSISSTMTSGSSLTRYLGLFVSSLSGPSAFTGADSATLRFTLVIP